MGRSGQAITLLAATELQKMHEIERALGHKLPRLTLDQLAWADEASPPVVQAPEVQTSQIEVVEAPESVQDGSAAKRRRRRRRSAVNKAEAAAAS
jgi:superfamily II DNA/RNA helicase